MTLQKLRDRVVRPQDLCFTQDSICVTFQKPRNQERIDDAVDLIIQGRLSPKAFPKMNVVHFQDRLWSLDNRRLWVFKKAQVNLITVTQVALDFHDRFSALPSTSPYLYASLSNPDFFPRIRGYCKEIFTDEDELDPSSLSPPSTPHVRARPVEVPTKIYKQSTHHPSASRSVPWPKISSRHQALLPPSKVATKSKYSNYDGRHHEPAEYDYHDTETFDYDHRQREPLEDDRHYCGPAQFKKQHSDYPHSSRMRSTASPPLSRNHGTDRPSLPNSNKRSCEAARHSTRTPHEDFRHQSGRPDEAMHHPSRRIHATGHHTSKIRETVRRMPIEACSPPAKKRRAPSQATEFEVSSPAPKPPVPAPPEDWGAISRSSRPAREVKGSSFSRKANVPFPVRGPVREPGKPTRPSERKGPPLGNLPSYRTTEPKTAGSDRQACRMHDHHDKLPPLPVDRSVLRGGDSKSSKSRATGPTLPTTKRSKPSKPMSNPKPFSYDFHSGPKRSRPSKGSKKTVSSPRSKSPSTQLIDDPGQTSMPSSAFAKDRSHSPEIPDAPLPSLSTTAPLPTPTTTTREKDDCPTSDLLSPPVRSAPKSPPLTCRSPTSDLPISPVRCDPKSPPLTCRSPTSDLPIPPVRCAPKSPPLTCRPPTSDLPIPTVRCAPKSPPLTCRPPTSDLPIPPVKSAPESPPVTGGPNEEHNVDQFGRELHSSNSGTSLGPETQENHHHETICVNSATTQTGKESLGLVNCNPEIDLLSESEKHLFRLDKEPAVDPELPLPPTPFKELNIKAENLSEFEVVSAVADEINNSLQTPQTTPTAENPSNKLKEAEITHQLPSTTPIEPAIEVIDLTQQEEVPKDVSEQVDVDESIVECPVQYVTKGNLVESYLKVSRSLKAPSTAFYGDGDVRSAAGNVDVIVTEPPQPQLSTPVRTNEVRETQFAAKAVNATEHELLIIHQGSYWKNGHLEVARTANKDNSLKLSTTTRACSISGNELREVSQRITRGQTRKQREIERRREKRKKKQEIEALKKKEKEAEKEKEKEAEKKREKEAEKKKEKEAEKKKKEAEKKKKEEAEKKKKKEADKRKVSEAEKRKIREPEKRKLRKPEKREVREAEKKKEKETKTLRGNTSPSEVTNLEIVPYNAAKILPSGKKAVASGDMVYVKVNSEIIESGTEEQKSTGSSCRLHPYLRIIGPFRVRRLCNAFSALLELPDDCKMRPIFRLTVLTRSRCPLDNDLQNNRLLIKLQPEAILKKRVARRLRKKKVLHYLVKWKTLPATEATWEPESIFDEHPFLLDHIHAPLFLNPFMLRNWRA